MQVSVEEYHRLEAMPEGQKQAAMAAMQDVERQTGKRPPLDVRRKILAEAEEAIASRQQEASAADFDEIEPPGPLLICGRPCRKVSAGMLVILEIIKHPLVVGGGDVDAMEMTLADGATFMYVMSEPDTAKLVREARNGTLADAATVWAFEIDEAELVNMLHYALTIWAGIGDALPEAISQPGNGRARSDG